MPMISISNRDASILTLAVQSADPENPQALEPETEELLQEASPFAQQIGKYILTNGAEPAGLDGRSSVVKAAKEFKVKLDRSINGSTSPKRAAMADSDPEL